MDSTTTYSRGLSASIVGEDDHDVEPIRLLVLARRFASAVFLSSLFGLALGAREGGMALLTHAAGVPAGLLAVTVLGVPGLYIVLALAGAPLRADGLFDAASRASGTAGLVMGGLAPATAMYVVTTQELVVAQGVAAVVLVVAGAIGLRSLLRSIRRQLDDADSPVRFVGLLVSLGFAMFGVVLAARVWSSTLTLFAGAS